MWVHVWAADSKGTVSSVPAWFRVDSGMNLIKQMEIVTGRRCMWFFSSVVWVLARYARGPWFELPVEPYTVSSPVSFGGSVWVHVRAASSQKTVPSHCSFEPISLPNILPETQLTCENVSKALRDYYPKMRDITWIMLGHVTQQSLGRNLRCKSIYTNIFSWWENTETQCSVLVDTKVLNPTTLSTLFGKQFML